MTQTPLAQTLWPGRTDTKSADLGRDALLVLAFSLVTALSAQVAVPLPFSPVPLTGQTFGVLLTGALLGPRLGTLAMLLYLTEGAAGLLPLGWKWVGQKHEQPPRPNSGEPEKTKNTCVGRFHIAPQNWGGGAAHA